MSGAAVLINGHSFSPPPSLALSESGPSSSAVPPGYPRQDTIYLDFSAQRVFVVAVVNLCRPIAVSQRAVC